MNIETKMNIGDTIFFLFDSKIIESVVRQITTNTESDGIEQVAEVKYMCSKDFGDRVRLKVKEENSFKSKKELIASL